MSVTALDRDPFEARLVRGVSGLLREFNEAGVLAAADVHVARRLGGLAGERDEAVLLAVALAVRGPRLGHVLVDLAQISGSAAIDAEELDVGALAWPEPLAWIAAVGASGLVAAEDAAQVQPRPLRLWRSRLYLDRYWAEERLLAATLRARAGARAAGVDEERLSAGLERLFGEDRDGRQAAAAAAAVRRPLAVIAGGPGTGKTTTVARIAALLCEQALEPAAAAGAASGPAASSGYRPPLPLIALAAPTGKAAARLQEAVHDEAAAIDVPAAIREHLLGLGASTIHRLLGWRPGSGSRFAHDRGRRLPHDVVIVDETSMVSLSLMARLVEALRADARLVLIGDPAQLASIEAGAVLGDIVGPAAHDRPGDIAGPAASERQRAVVVLDRVHRFGGGIARLAEAIRRGDGDATIAALNGGAPDVEWVDVDVAGEADADAGGALAPVAVPALAAAVATVRAARAGDAGVALESLSSFRILCAHRRGPYGVALWAGRLEAWLADELGDLDPLDRWYVGRPLLVTENDPELRLANGDLGVVVRAAPDRVVAAFARGRELIQYSPSRLSAVQTVHAMTIHKSQGSQFDQAAVLLPEAGSRILTRELLYTAATRARRRLIVAGSEEAIRAAVARPVARASGLGERLWGGDAG